MEYTGLTDERNSWIIEINEGRWLEPFVLKQYRENRGSNLWRSTREVEKLCEYVLFLERKLKNQENLTMEQVRPLMDNESLSTLLRSNLSCYLGKNITLDSLNEITVQIVESIDYMLNKND